MVRTTGGSDARARPSHQHRRHVHDGIRRQLRGPCSLLRFAGGIASAGVMVFATTLALDALKRLGHAASIRIASAELGSESRCRPRSRRHARSYTPVGIVQLAYRMAISAERSPSTFALYALRLIGTHEPLPAPVRPDWPAKSRLCSLPSPCPRLCALRRRLRYRHDLHRIARSSDRGAEGLGVDNLVHDGDRSGHFRSSMGHSRRTHRHRPGSDLRLPPRGHCHRRECDGHAPHHRYRIRPWSSGEPSSASLRSA